MVRPGGTSIWGDFGPGRALRALGGLFPFGLGRNERARDVDDAAAAEAGPGPAKPPPGVEAVDSVVRVSAGQPVDAPRVETTVRVRPTDSGPARQRVFVVGPDDGAGDAMRGDGRLIRRRAFLEKRAGDLRSELENKRQLAASKRAYASQLLASATPEARRQAAYLDSATFDASIAAIEGELRALEAELSSIAGKLAVSVLSEAAQAEGAAAALQAAVPAPIPDAPIELTVEEKPE